MLEPTQPLVFLGFTVDTTKMELSLPPDKLKKIRAEARKLMGAEPVSARSVARLLGKMSATTEVILQAPLFYRHLQMDLTTALRAACQDYETVVMMSPGSRDWWDMNMVRWNGRSVLMRDPNLTIESDTSYLGWKALCQSMSTGGPWSTQEKTRHINCLELLAATLTLKTFTKNERDLSVWLRIDNTTAVAYINNQRKTVSQLFHLTCDLWMWCLKRNIHAEHLPGRLNTAADRELSSMKDWSDWKLDVGIFKQIDQTFSPLEVDLFASSLMHQCRRYFSW